MVSAGERVLEMAVGKVAPLILGRLHSKVSLGFSRGNFSFSVTLARSSIAGQTVESSTRCLCVEGQADEMGVKDAPKGDGGQMFDVVGPSYMPSEAWQGGREGGGPCEVVRGNEVVVRQDKIEDQEGGGESEADAGIDDDWVWMWRAHDETRRRIRANHSAVIRRLQGQVYAADDITKARVVLTTSDGFISPHVDVLDALIAVEGIDDTISLQPGNHSLCAHDEGREGTFGPIDLHAVLTLEATKGGWGGISARAQEKETEEGSCSLKNATIADDKNKGFAGHNPGSRRGEEWRGQEEGLVQDLGAKEMAEVWTMQDEDSDGAAETCLYTGQGWPLVVCFQARACLHPAKKEGHPAVDIDLAY